MNKASFGLFPALAAIAFICIPAVGFAQNPVPTRDKFVISARAGGVNAVTGGAAVRTHGNTEWELLTITEDLETGDIVKTGTDGRVEMLLNPGSYLRLGENSEFELANNSLDKLEIRLIRGTAIVEATGADDSQLQINISTPHTKLAIVRRGLYRLNVVPGDNTELIVRKGRVMLDRSQTKITGGNKVVFSGDAFLVAKMQKADKKKVDALDTWSKERGETVAQANRKIRGREIGSMMAGVRDRWFQSFSASSGGFWYFSQRFGCYTFIPFFMGWGSPYGSSYSSAFFPGYSCGGCRRLDYRNNYPSGTSVAGGGAGNSGSSRGGSTPSPTMGPISGPARSMDSAPRSRALEGRLDRHQQIGRPNN
jgi:hypothetical protein